jgi:hypothetical protein
MARRRFRWWPFRRARKPIETQPGGLVDIQASVPFHDWRECRPAMLELDTGGPSHSKRDQVTEVMMLVWSRLHDSDRQAFHRVCCLNSRAPEDVAVMEHLSTTMAAEFARRGL